MVCIDFVSQTIKFIVFLIRAKEEKRRKKKTKKDSKKDKDKVVFCALVISE